MSIAKINLKFLDFHNDTDFIRCESLNEDGQVPVIKIDGYDSDNQTDFTIYLDKPTAIKFAKTIRTEINKLKEVNNG